MKSDHHYAWLVACLVGFVDVAPRPTPRPQPTQSAPTVGDARNGPWLSWPPPRWPLPFGVFQGRREQREAYVCGLVQHIRDYLVLPDGLGFFSSNRTVPSLQWLVLFKLWTSVGKMLQGCTLSINPCDEPFMQPVQYFYRRPRGCLVLGNSSLAFSDPGVWFGSLTPSAQLQKCDV